LGLYARLVLPRVIDLACRAKPNRRQRNKIVPKATGRVLELGFGSGLNLEFYDPGRVERIWALEPAAEMWRLARAASERSPIRVEWLEAGAERVPLPDASVDTVLVTYTLCTIPDVDAALAEARRVLAPGGRLLFCEHGEAPDPGVRRWQRRLNPVWSRLGGGCNLDRPIPALLGRGGFEIAELETMYLPGWRPATFNFWGSAKPAASSGPDDERGGAGP